MPGTTGVREAEEGAFLQACRRVLVAGVLARGRSEVLAVDPVRWPRSAAHLRERIASALAPPSPGTELDVLDLGRDLHADLHETLEQAMGTAPRLSQALLQLQLDCTRARFVFEETALRLRGDPDRFAHAETHGRLLSRLGDAKACLRSRRFEDARALLRAFRAELAEHEDLVESSAGRRAEGEA